VRIEMENQHLYLEGLSEHHPAAFGSRAEARIDALDS